MKTFRLKTSDIQAVVIDAAWLAFLNNEKGIDYVSIGDYYFINAEGNECTMPKENFENLFSSVG